MTTPRRLDLTKNFNLNVLYKKMPKPIVIGGVVVILIVVIVVIMMMMGGNNKNQVEAPKAAPVEAPEAAPVNNDQSWRDKNPGAVMGTFSAACVTAKTFDPNVKYKGPSNDNYYNYCHEMVISQTPSCKVELCANENVYGACKDECNRK